MANGPGLDNLNGLVFSKLIQPLLNHSATDGALPVLLESNSTELNRPIPSGAIL